MALSGISAGFPSVDPTATAQETTLTPRNGSDHDPSKNSNMEDLILIFLIIIFALVGLAGNAVVLWHLGFCMKRNAFSTYILNLAGADFLFLCCLVLCSLNTLIYYFHSGAISLPICLEIVLTFSYVAGLSLLSAISIERCLSVLWPIWYRCHRPRHTSAVTCTLLWVLSLLLSIMEVETCGLLVGYARQNWCRVFDFIATTWLLFLFVLLSGSSLALLTRLCGSQRMPLTRLYVTVLLTVLVFVLCGLPWGINWLVLFWSHTDFDVLSHLQPLSILLSCVNSCANPIIYFFVGSYRQHLRRRRQTLKLVLQRALQDSPEPGEHGGSLPQEALEMPQRGVLS